MEIFQKFGFFGLFLFILTVSIPLLLIASKGFKRDTYRGSKGEKSIIKIVLFAIFSLFILPSLLFLVYNFVKFVMIEKMSIANFKTNFWFLSFQPVIDFYNALVGLIRSYISNIFSVK